MPLSFPSSPTVGQTSTQNGRSYTYRGNNVWELTPSSGGGGSLSGSVTIPASGDPYYSQVALLLSMNGNLSSVADASPTPKGVTASGNATQSATQSRWGGKSLYLSGSSDYLSLESSSVWNLSGGAFVLEAWVRPDATQSGGGAGQGNAGAIFSTRNSAVFCPYELSIRNDLKLSLLVKGPSFTWQNSIPASSTALTANAWSHVALVHNGTTTTLYINGVADATISGLSFTYANESAPLWIGLGGDGSFRGYIDDVRITKSTDRGMTGSTITVPDAAFGVGPYVAQQVLPVVFT